MDSNLGAWDEHYENLEAPESYGGDPTYPMAAAWMEGCATVEDWGCGKGWLRQFCDPAAYRGIDGSCTPFADVVADLATYRSDVDGIVLRHVLEHDYRWGVILAGAIASCRERLCVILFTPQVEKTRVLHTEPDYHDVPVIAFRLEDITDPIEADGFEVEVEVVQCNSFYGADTVIRANR